MALPAPAAPNLILNGKVASTNVQVLNGQAYVSLQDLAKALGMVVEKGADGNYEIKKPGGTTQVEGLNGKIGDVIFDGKWRFSVLSVSTPASYLMKTSGGASEGWYAGDVVKWDNQTHIITPGRGYQLVVLQCRVINAVPQKRTLWVADRDSNTALADADGNSFPVVAYDFDGAPIQSKPLLQGSKLDFNIVFSVPQGTKLKDLIFTLVANGDLENPRDARVSLTAAGESTPPPATGGTPPPAGTEDDLPDANVPSTGGR
jgi:hypothetical protein